MVKFAIPTESRRTQNREKMRTVRRTGALTQINYCVIIVDVTLPLLRNPSSLFMFVVWSNRRRTTTTDHLNENDNVPKCLVFNTKIQRGGDFSARSQSLSKFYSTSEGETKEGLGGCETITSY